METFKGYNIIKKLVQSDLIWFFSGTVARFRTPSMVNNMKNMIFADFKAFQRTLYDVALTTDKCMAANQREGDYHDNFFIAKQTLSG